MSSELAKTWREQLGESVDSALDRTVRFLDKKNAYAISIESDHLGTGRVWIVAIHGKVNDLYAAYLCDSTEVAAIRLCRSMSLLLQVFGYNIQSKSGEEISYTEAESNALKDLESLKTFGDIRLEIKQEPVFKVFSFIAHHQDKQICLASLGGISEKAAIVLSKQFAIFLAAMGKDIISDDGTLMSRYGAVNMCPQDIDEKTQSFGGLQPWLLASNSMRCVMPPMRLIDRVDYNPFQTRSILFSHSCRYLGWTDGSGFHTHCSLIDAPIEPPDQRTARLEMEMYSEVEAEQFIKTCVRQFIEKYGLIKIKLHVVKKTFQSTNKACLSLVIEDARE